MSLSHLHNPVALLTAILVTSALSAAPAPIRANTRIRHCGSETCLAVTGHRVDAAAPILLAGHGVTPRGGRNWRMIVPVATVREWAPPFARSIRVEVAGEGHADARLPIGLLGHEAELAFLDVSARR